MGGENTRFLNTAHTNPIAEMSPSPLYPSPTVTGDVDIDGDADVNADVVVDVNVDVDVDGNGPYRAVSGRIGPLRAVAVYGIKTGQVQLPAHCVPGAVVYAFVSQLRKGLMALASRDFLSLDSARFLPRVVK